MGVAGFQPAGAVDTMQAGGADVSPRCWLDVTEMRHLLQGSDRQHVQDADAAAPVVAAEEDFVADIRLGGEDSNAPPMKRSASLDWSAAWRGMQRRS